jgi:flagellar motility protein MotE (MotC chaperone)
MRRLPLIPLALLAVVASLTTRFDAVLAAGQTVAGQSQKPAAAPPPQSRAAAAISDRLAVAAGADQSPPDDLEAALMQAAEKRIDDKLDRLESATRRQRRVDDLPVRRIAPGASVRQIAAAPADGLTQLVRMYQSMRPKDAARIFEQLELGVQVEVASRMRERAMASILAEMNPKAAGRLTMALAGRPPADTDAL